MYRDITCHIYLSIYIYIYIWRERERKRAPLEGAGGVGALAGLHDRADDPSEVIIYNDKI